jgi:hypothetical protein
MRDSQRSKSSATVSTYPPYLEESDDVTIGQAAMVASCLAALGGDRDGELTGRS